LNILSPFPVSSSIKYLAVSYEELNLLPQGKKPEKGNTDTRKYILGGLVYFDVGLMYLL
jgi:hypothetical protein